MGNAISIPNMTLQMKNQRQVMRIRERNAKGKKKMLCKLMMLSLKIYSPCAENFRMHVVLLGKDKGDYSLW